MSIKSLGKIAAVAAAAGLALTACADASVEQARDQEETCGLIQAANMKANDAMGSLQNLDGANPRAAFSLESVALDLRQHAFDRSDDEPVAQGDETLQVRTALQVQAEQFQQIAEGIEEDASVVQDIDQESIQVDGMTLTEASEVLGSYCATQGGGF